MCCGGSPHLLSLSPYLVLAGRALRSRSLCRRSSLARRLAASRSNFTQVRPALPTHAILVVPARTARVPSFSFYGMYNALAQHRLLDSVACPPLFLLSTERTFLLAHYLSLSLSFASYYAHTSRYYYYYYLYYPLSLSSLERCNGHAPYSGTYISLSRSHPLSLSLSLLLGQISHLIRAIYLAFSSSRRYRSPVVFAVD